MDFSTLLNVVQKHKLMTVDHFKSINGQEHNCQCVYCLSKAGPLTCKTLDELSYTVKCNFCPTLLYHSKVRVMPYPYCDVFLESWPLGKLMEYWFCARCQEKCVFKCIDCKKKDQSLCDGCNEHLEQCGYKQGQECRECHLFRAKP